MATFTLGGETYGLVTSKLTFAEARAFEKVTGHSIGELSENGAAAKSAATTQALIWISMKRVRPEMKFSDLDSLPIDDIEWADDEGADDEADPTQRSADEPAPSPSSD